MDFHSSRLLGLCVGVVCIIGFAWLETDLKRIIALTTVAVCAFFGPDFRLGYAMG